METTIEMQVEAIQVTIIELRKELNRLANHKLEVELNQRIARLGDAVIQLQRFEKIARYLKEVDRKYKELQNGHSSKSH